MEEELSEYELLQKKNIEERNQFLRSLGINNAINDVITDVNSKNKIKKKKESHNIKRSRISQELPKREPSRRLQSLALANTKVHSSPFKTEIEVQEKLEEEAEEYVDNRLKGTVTLEEESHDFLENLRCLNENYTYDPNIDISCCSIESFRSNLACLKMMGPHKIVDKRIQSLCIHPTVSKQLVLVGCVSGSLGLWDTNAESENDIVKFSYHKGPLNCISVSNFNQYKIYTTSHDGSVCCVDINQKQCSNVFSTDCDQRLRHLTWHDEINDNNLLIAHGNGDVGVLDLRQDNEMFWINCFDRSCRTVQLHPQNSNYFLVSSGTVGCKVFDLRSSSKNVCVSDIPHPKGLTSAFYSPDGNNILTTCNDDRIRIFDTSSLRKEKKVIVHNNHTGRWLSVFKAAWFPYRNDVFSIGSLLSPRRIQVYETSGQVLYDLKQDDMVTISPLIAVHPKLLILAGGNSSGRVHLFKPPTTESDSL